jgi:2,4-dichlorophenol 6-monooxygenase
MLAVTPTPLRNLSQHRLEPLLLSPDLDVRYRHRWSSASETADGMLIVVDGPDGEYAVESSYLLAADGAASSVRRWTGIEMTGPRTIQSFVMVHLRADFTSLVATAPGVLHFVVDPASSGTFVSHGADREWVYMHAWDPETEPLESFTEQRSRDLVLAALSRDDVDFEVAATSTWHMSAQIADRYRHGRTFLVGDAAHRFPPTGGLGLNTGVADAHNLLWKIAAVRDGWASDSVLDTYETERRPVAQFNCDQSLHNAFKMIEIPMAFGFTPDVEESTAAMHASLADPHRRAAVEQAIANQAIHFDLLGLQLGHAYDGPLVIGDGIEPAPLEEPARDYVPSTRPGGRLPHAWLPDGRSTLDLIDVRVPTVLVRDGATVTGIGSSDLVRVVSCPADAWDTAFALDTDVCLVVRPDQHIAARGTAVECVAAFAQACSDRGSDDPARRRRT